MFRQNLDRLYKIKQLREQGYTIDQIASMTGYPRSSVGYYVKKHCRRTRAVRKEVSVRTINAENIKSSQPFVPRFIPEDIERNKRMQKRGRSVMDIITEDKKKDVTSMLIQEGILELFEKDPKILYYRLKAIGEMLKLKGFLGIDLDNIRKMIGLYMSRKS